MTTPKGICYLDYKICLEYQKMIQWLLGDGWQNGLGVWFKGIALNKRFAILVAKNQNSFKREGIKQDYPLRLEKDFKGERFLGLFG